MLETFHFLKPLSWTSGWNLHSLLTGPLTCNLLLGPCTFMWNFYAKLFAGTFNLLCNLFLQLDLKPSNFCRILFLDPSFGPFSFHPKTFTGTFDPQREPFYWKLQPALEHFCWKHLPEPSTFCCNLLVQPSTSIGNPLTGAFNLLL